MSKPNDAPPSYPPPAHLDAGPYPPPQVPGSPAPTSAYGPPTQYNPPTQQGYFGGSGSGGGPPFPPQQQQQQGYYGSGPMNQGYGGPPGPYGAPYGGQQQYQQGMYYQQQQGQPQGQPQGFYADGRGKRGPGAGGGITAAVLGACAVCCCLDILF